MLKVLIIFLFSLLMFDNCFAQKYPTRIYGTMLIDKNVSMKATEVTIQEWMCFIIDNNIDSTLFPNNQSISASTKLLFDDLKKGKNFEYLKVVDYADVLKYNFGSKGVKPSKQFKKLTESDTNYFSINIPITGITYNQVQRFCKWKEKLINSSQATKVNITLPTEEIYKIVMIDKDSLNLEKCSLFNSMNCNCLTLKNKKDNKSQGKCLVRVDSYWPTDLGLYNLQGNAAEMTNKEGIAIGGSFRHYARESYKDRRQEYSKAEDWLGFRYIVTLR